jgi:hypothetical protein
MRKQNQPSPVIAGRSESIRNKRVRFVYSAIPQGNGWRRIASSFPLYVSTTATVPVTIAYDASALVNWLRERQEFERMIDRAKHVVLGLASIEVALDEATDEMPPGVILWTHRDDIGTDDEPTQRSWMEWMAATFRPEVCQNFVLLPVYRANGR